MREVVVPRALVGIPFTCPPKHVFVNGELESALAVNDSLHPAVNEPKKKCRITGLQAMPVHFLASAVLSKHTFLIFETHCNQSFVTAAGVCFSLGIFLSITGVCVSQAASACFGARVALPSGN